MGVHRHLSAIGKNKVGPVAEFFYETEYVVPAPTIETGRMISDLVEDLVHLECGKNCLNKKSGLDSATRYTEPLLSVDKYIIPESRFQMALYLRQVEVWPGASLNKSLRVMEEVETEIE